MRIAAPFGFYGYGNIGDEATLHGFSLLLSQSGVAAQVSVASQNPAHTGRVVPSLRYFKARGFDPRRWLANRRAAAHIVIGGTPIMDCLGDWPLSELAPLVTATDRTRVPMSFVGVGIESLKAERSRRIVAEEIAPRVRYWTVRSARDRERLLEYGASPEAVCVAADMAWLIPPATTDFGKEQLRRWGVDDKQPLVGVNLVNENALFDRHPNLVEATARALDDLTSRLDGRVIFLANEVRQGDEFDRAAAERVLSKMQYRDRAVVPAAVYYSPQQMMSIIACCRLTMSMRYHFCLFSAVQNVSFIAIQRTDKVSDLCWDLNWEAGVVPPVFGADDLIEHGRRLIDDRTAQMAPLEQRVAVMRKRAGRNAEAIARLLDTQQGVYEIGATTRAHVAGQGLGPNERRSI
jgi:polysaccharide pyruvyl transferase WcaK-like protein